MKKQFDGIDLIMMKSLKLSENSYGTAACEWIAENVLRRAKNLEDVNFSDMFTSRLRSDLPNSLRILINGLNS